MMMSKKTYFKKSNKQDPATDMLKNSYKLDFLKEYARKKARYT